MDTGLLKTVLFANIRFHDTVSRGRLLNRFGKDFEGKAAVLVNAEQWMLMLHSGIDSSLSDNFGRSLIYCLSAITTLITVSVVGGWTFLIAAAILGYMYWSGRGLDFGHGALVIEVHVL